MSVWLAFSIHRSSIIDHWSAINDQWYVRSAIDAMRPCNWHFVDIWQHFDNHRTFIMHLPCGLHRSHLVQIMITISFINQQLSNVKAIARILWFVLIDIMIYNTWNISTTFVLNFRWLLSWQLTLCIKQTASLEAEKTRSMKATW